MDEQEKKWIERLTKSHGESGENPPWLTTER
jgi:hypothetical protein